MKKKIVTSITVIISIGIGIFGIYSLWYYNFSETLQNQHDYDDTRRAQKWRNKQKGGRKKRRVKKH